MTASKKDTSSSYEFFNRSMQFFNYQVSNFAIIKSTSHFLRPFQLLKFKYQLSSFLKKVSNFTSIFKIGFQLTIFFQIGFQLPNFSKIGFQLPTFYKIGFQLPTFSKLASNFQLQYRNLGGDRPPPDRISLQP